MLNLGHGIFQNAMEKGMESYGILTAQNCMNHVLVVALAFQAKDQTQQDRCSCVVHACTHLPMSCYFQNDLLTEAFGSNRKKRAMASRHRNKVNKNELNETVSDVLESLAKEPMDTTGLLNYSYLMLFLNLKLSIWKTALHLL